MVLSALRVIPIIYSCDVVHALDVNPFGLIAWMATRIIRRPLIISGIGSYTVAALHNASTSWLARRACHDAHTIVPISAYTAARIRVFAPHAHIEVVPPGVRPVEGAARLSMPLRIISVGALKERKGYHVALEAFALARQRIPELTYVIVGDQRDRVYVRRIHNIITTLGISESVTLRQHIRDDALNDEYQRAGLFLLPSVNVDDHFEGFGLVFLEAAAMGLPVIGTTGNGIADAVGDENGILVSQGDIRATADEICNVLGVEECWRRMSNASVAWAREHSIDAMIDAYERVYHSALNT